MDRARALECWMLIAGSQFTGTHLPPSATPLGCSSFLPFSFFHRSLPPFPSPSSAFSSPFLPSFPFLHPSLFFPPFFIPFAPPSFPSSLSHSIHPSLIPSHFPTLSFYSFLFSASFGIPPYHSRFTRFISKTRGGPFGSDTGRLSARRVER